MLGGVADGASGGIAELNKLNVGDAGTFKFESVWQPAAVDLNSYDYGADLMKLTDVDVDGKPDLLLPTLSPDYEVAFTRAYALAFPASTNPTKILHSTAFQAKTTTETLGDLANGQEVITATILDGASGAEFGKLIQDTFGYEPQKRKVVLYDTAMLTMLATIYAVQANNLADPTEVTGAQIATRCGRSPPPPTCRRRSI